MELHRTRAGRVPVLLGGILCLLCPLGIVANPAVDLAGFGTGGLAMLVLLSGFSGWLGISVLRAALGRFRFQIGSDGLTVRTGRFRGRIGWPEIEALALVDAPGPGGTAAGAQRARLLLLPATGVELRLPPARSGPADGRVPLLLLELREVDDDPAEIAAALTRFGGGRFHNLSNQLGPPPEGRSLAAFPAGAARRRVVRWLDRRKTRLFLGWYLLLFVPSLLIVYAAASLSDLLGVAASLAAMAGVGGLTYRLAMKAVGCRDLIRGTATVVPGQLVTEVAGSRHRFDLQTGRTRVLRPGELRWYGQAWLLAVDGHRGRPNPVLLLSDPTSGEVRVRPDLQPLIRELDGSPHQRDRAAARTLAELAPPHPTAGSTAGPAGAEPEPAGAEPEPAGAEPEPAEDGPTRRSLWGALRAFGRTIPLLLVVASVALTAHALDGRLTGLLLVFVAAGIGGLWLLYLLVRTILLAEDLRLILAGMMTRWRDPGR